MQKDVAGLDFLNDLILVPGVLEFELVLEIKLVARVIIDIDPQFVPDRACDAKAEVLLEFRVELRRFSGNRDLLVTFSVVETGMDIGCPVDAQIHFVGSEDGPECTLPATWNNDVEPETAPAALLVLPLPLQDELLPVVIQILTHPRCPVLIEFESKGVTGVPFAYLLPDRIGPGQRVKFDVMAPPLSQRRRHHQPIPLVGRSA